MDVVLRLIPFFLLVAAGALAARTGRIDLNGARALSSYVFWISFPALLIHSLSTMPPPDAHMAVSLAAYCIGMALPLAIIIPLGRKLGWSRETRAGTGASALAGNIAFLTGPFIISIFGPASAGPVAAVVAVDTVIIVGLAAALLVSASKEAHSGARIAALTVTNPLVLGAALGAVMSYSGYAFTGPAEKALSLLAATASPVGLVALGVVVGLEFGKPSKGEAGPVFTAMGIKLALAPALVWIITGAVGAEPMLRAVCTLAAAAPTAVNVFIQTRTLDVFARGGAMAVVLTTLTTAVTLSVLGGVLVHWLGLG